MGSGTWTGEGVWCVVRDKVQLGHPTWDSQDTGTRARLAVPVALAARAQWPMTTWPPSWNQHGAQLSSPSQRRQSLCWCLRGWASVPCGGTSMAPDYNPLINKWPAMVCSKHLTVLRILITSLELIAIVRAALMLTRGLALYNGNLRVILKSVFFFTTHNNILAKSS